MLATAVIVPGAAGCRAHHGDVRVRVATEAKVNGQVAALAADIAAVLGAEPIHPASNTSECENDIGDDFGQVRFVQGTYRIPVADSHDRANHVKVRDHWLRLGWTVVEDWYKPETRAGGVSMEEAGDGMSFSLSGTASPGLMGVLIHSGCFRDRPLGASPS